MFEYEEGILSISVRKKWYQFWLPKSVDYGNYITIGTISQVSLIGKQEKIFIIGTMDIVKYSGKETILKNKGGNPPLS